jgi:NAD(P)-dependent dehydrogenase (short-subunit alcohol dehydrogenase family)
MRADVSLASDIQAMVEQAVSEFGRLDILVNNAFAAPMGAGERIDDVTEAEFDSGMGLLVKAHFLSTKSAAPHMRAVGGGSIVNISSVHGLLAAPGALVYETGKHAVIGITRQMATELGPDGIRVNAICPGHIVTERIQETWDRFPTGLSFFEDQYPLRRAGKPVDIANAVVFLCSEEASFITGHALVVDGGLTVQLQENFGVRQARFVRENPEVELPY